MFRAIGARTGYGRAVKWLVRIAAGVTIALLIQAALTGLMLFRVAFTVALFLIFFVGLHEGIDMSGFWGDDDDDGQGPMRPA